MWSPFISLVLISCFRKLFASIVCIVRLLLSFWSCLNLVLYFFFFIYTETRAHAGSHSSLWPHHSSLELKSISIECESIHKHHYLLLTKCARTRAHISSRSIAFHFVVCVSRKKKFFVSSLEIIINWMCFVTVFGCGFRFSSSSSVYAYSFRLLCVCVCDRLDSDLLFDSLDWNCYVAIWFPSKARVHACTQGPYRTHIPHLPVHLILSKSNQIKYKSKRTLYNFNWCNLRLLRVYSTNTRCFLWFPFIIILRTYAAKHPTKIYTPYSSFVFTIPNLPQTFVRTMWRWRI